MVSRGVNKTPKRRHLRVLVTGGAGFVGHHIVDHFIKNTDWTIVVLDRLSYASYGLNRLRDSNCFSEDRILVLTADFAKPIVDGLAEEIGDVDYIIHCGGETHVDRSIMDPRPFVYSNVVGTMEVLEFAKSVRGLKKFVYFSTDEVFGPALSGQKFKEWDRYNSSTPYSASKAGGEELVIAYGNTYGLPVVVQRVMNIFGERQHPEKFIPMTIKKVLSGETVIIHADKTRTHSGSRFWIHARNVADATLFLLTSPHILVKEKYNISSDHEVSNLEIAQIIANTLGKELKYEMEPGDACRAAHDFRYALDGSKLYALGWKPPKNFISSMVSTIQWFVNPVNVKWLGK